MAVTFLPRADWDDSGASRAGYVVPERQFVGLVVHHTVTIHAPAPGLGDEIAHMRRLRTIRPDLGVDVPYSAVVFRGEGPDDAVLAEGRGPGRTGAHTSGYNSTRYGIAYAGNSDSDPMTPGVLEAIRLAGRMWVPWATEPTVGHGQLPGQGTVCPGAWLRDHLAELQPPFESLGPASTMTPPRRRRPMNLEPRLDPTTRQLVELPPGSFGLAEAGICYDLTLAPRGATVAVHARDQSLGPFNAVLLCAGKVYPLKAAGWGAPATWEVDADGFATVVVPANCTPDRVRAVAV